MPEVKASGISFKDFKAPWPLVGHKLAKLKLAVRIRLVPFIKKKAGEVI